MADPTTIPPAVPPSSAPTVQPVVPIGTPPTDPGKPQFAVTQEQINFFINHATALWPAFKQFWPIVVMIAGLFGVGGVYTAKVVSPPTAVADCPVPITKKDVEDAVKKGILDVLNLKDKGAAP